MPPVLVYSSMTSHPDYPPHCNLPLLIGLFSLQLVLLLNKLCLRRYHSTIFTVKSKFIFYPPHCNLPLCLSASLPLGPLSLQPGLLLNKLCLRSYHFLIFTVKSKFILTFRTLPNVTTAYLVLGP